MMWKNSHILIPLWLDHPQFRWIKQVNKVIYAFLYNILVQYIIFSPLSFLTSCICCVIITLECPKTHSELPLTSNHSFKQTRQQKKQQSYLKKTRKLQSFCTSRGCCTKEFAPFCVHCTLRRFNDTHSKRTHRLPRHIKVERKRETSISADARDIQKQINRYGRH